MDIHPDQLADLPTEALIAALPDFLAQHIVDASARSAAAEDTRACVSAWSTQDAESVRDHLLTLGSDIVVYRAHPLLRVLSRGWCKPLFTELDVHGVPHLAGALQSGPVVIVGNHMAYVDSQATDAALALAGHADLADRMVTVAGPKVYESLFRRFAAGCLSTLPVPQSGAVSTADVSPRELAKRAIRSLGHARELTQAGDILQIYPEGTRTRTGHMGAFLKGVHRYVGHEGCRIVPMAHGGTDQMYPLDADRLTPAPYAIRFLEPIVVADAGGSRAALEAAWHAIAEALPERLKPEADTVPLA